jgi:hypothetical protein
LQDKQLKQPPAVKQYKINQAGTLVKSSIEMYDFMCVIVLTPWDCILQPRVSRYVSALFGPGANLNKN